MTKTRVMSSLLQINHRASKRSCSLETTGSFSDTFCITRRPQNFIFFHNDDLKKKFAFSIIVDVSSDHR